MIKRCFHSKWNRVYKTGMFFNIDSKYSLFSAYIYKYIYIYIYKFTGDTVNKLEIYMKYQINENK